MCKHTERDISHLESLCMKERESSSYHIPLTIGIRISILEETRSYQELQSLNHANNFFVNASVIVDIALIFKSLSFSLPL